MTRDGHVTVVTLPEHDTRPQPVTIYDAKTRPLVTLTADEFRRRCGLPMPVNRQYRDPPPVAPRQCPACGQRLGKGGVCLACACRRVKVKL